MPFQPIPAPPSALAVIAREHQAARAQREARRGDGADRPPSSGPVDFRTSERHQTAYLSIGPDQGRFLFTLALSRGARRIVEFGSSFGISTLYLAAAARLTGGRVTGSEFHAAKAEKATRSLGEAELSDFAEIRVGDARETLESVEGPVDLLFLDGAKELYLPILRMLEPRLAQGGLVVADNADHLTDDDPFLAHVGGNGYVTSRVGFGKGAMTLSMTGGSAAR